MVNTASVLIPAFPIKPARPGRLAPPACLSQRPPQGQVSGWVLLDRLVLTRMRSLPQDKLVKRNGAEPILARTTQTTGAVCASSPFLRILIQCFTSGYYGQQAGQGGADATQMQGAP